MNTAPNADPFLARARRLGLWGLIDHWAEIGPAERAKIVDWEENTRHNRSLQRRLGTSKIGRFKPLADFDWLWPRKIDREAVHDIMTTEFIRQAENVILIGPNGVGKTMIAKNIAHHAILQGHQVRFCTASELLSELLTQDTVHARQRRLQRYIRPDLLVIDELGYLAYDNRHADLLFEVVSARHLKRSTFITTNLRFEDWKDVFPNAACVVSLVDRLTHRAEIITIDAQSYRLKEAQEHAATKAATRAARKAR